MILFKCIDNKCGKKFSEEDVDALRASGTKILKKCPACQKNKLTWNITNRFARKRWYGYPSQDKSIVEYLVLVIIDEFDDKSIDIEIPLLKLFFTTNDHLAAMQTAIKSIDEYLMQHHRKSYDNNQQFITTAYCETTEPFRHNVPVWF
jgi:hypothetical protein